jgi:hypothetical protein
MSDIALNQVPGIADAARQAADGHVVYLLDDGVRRAALVPVEFAAILDDLTPEQARQLVDELADAVSVQAARAAIRDGEPVIPWEQAKAEAGL